MTNWAGWGCIKLLTRTPLEYINNPRKIFLKAVEEEKDYLAHFCDFRGNSICKKAYMPHEEKMNDAVTDYWKQSYEELENVAVICEECKELTDGLPK